jgi:hypothetical protein
MRRPRMLGALVLFALTQRVSAAAPPSRTRDTESPPAQQRGLLSASGEILRSPHAAQFAEAQPPSVNRSQAQADHLLRAIQNFSERAPSSRSSAHAKDLIVPSAISTAPGNIAGSLAPGLSVIGFGAIPGDGKNDRAAFQAAINAAAPGETVFVPIGVFDLDGDGTELLLIDAKPITLRCAGWGLTKLQVAGGVGASTDVIRHRGMSEGLRIVDCQIVPASGMPARHGIHLDASSSFNGERPISKFIIEHNVVGPFGGNAVQTTFPEPHSDGIFNGAFRDNYFRSGIDLDRIGDTIAVRDNTVAGIGPGIRVKQVRGSSQLVIDHNSIVTCNGAVEIVEAEAPRITHNNFEPALGCATGRNDALVDLQGTSQTSVEGAEVRSNMFTGQPGTTHNHIRLDYVNGAIIEANTFAFGNSTQRAVRTTRHAYDTFIGPNTMHPFAGDLSLLLEDEGNRTMSFVPRIGRMAFGEVPSASTASPTRVSVKCRPLQSAKAFSVVNDSGKPYADLDLFSVGCDGVTTIFNGKADSSTNFVVRAGASQKSGLISVVGNDGTTELFSVGPTGTVTIGSGQYLDSAGTSFRGLGRAARGRSVWCTDCAVGVLCARGGSGAWAFANGARWICPF